jgi:hypothetical protein
LSVSQNSLDANGAQYRELSTTPITLGDAALDSQDALLVDLDNDGDLDLVVANGAPGSPQPESVYINDLIGNQVNLVLTTTLGSQVTWALASADLDGNGFIDIVAANGSPNEVFLNQGGGAFTTLLLPGDATSLAVAIADFDGDLRPDLVFANSDAPSELYMNLGGGAFGPMIPIETLPVVTVEAADVSGDGHPDIIFGRQSAPAPALPEKILHVNTSAPGAPSFVRSVVSRLGAAPTTDILAVDVSLDGRLDVITLNGTGTHQIYVGAGNSAFTLAGQQFSSAAPTGSATGDFNNDGRPDVAIAGPVGVDVFLNDGRGNLGPGDIDAPTIQLLGAASMTLNVGDPYTDAGATATDLIDGNLTASIVVTNPVDTAVIGTYTVTYNVYDRSGNPAPPVTRSIAVQTRPPAGGGGGGAMGLLSVALLALLAGWMKLRERRMRTARRVIALLAASTTAPAVASDLSYSFLDFGGLNVTAAATGTQSPAPGQTVTAVAGDGDGIGVGGSVGIGNRFFVAGTFESSIVIVDSTITSPLATAFVTDNFDLITTTISFGFLHELASNFDISAEISYDTSDYDFGSVAGENFDMAEGGVGAKVGVRWNPRPPFEIFAYARTSAVGEVDLTNFVFESAPSFGAGLRWYFFEDLGLGFDYEAGDVDTFMLSMRFGFGDFRF